MGGEVDAWRARFGRAAEDHVAERLQEHGVRLIARRYRVRGGEIDLVGLDGRTLVFVEVRARRTGGIDPGETVDRRKQARLRVAAAAFLRSWPGRRPPTRYDVVAVTSSRSGRLRSRWTRDAFRG